MKLVTFDDGKVGRSRATRSSARRAGHAHVLRARPAPPRPARGRARRRAPARADHPEEVLPHRRQLPRAPRGVQERQLVAPGAPWIVFFQNIDAIIGPDDAIVYPEHLTNELDYELELAVVIGKAGQVLLARGGRGLHRRLPDLQRHHRARHPARGDEVRRLLPLQGDRHVLPDRAVDRHARRDRRPARPRDGAARQRRVAPGRRTRAACR